MSLTKQHILLVDSDEQAFSDFASALSEKYVIHHVKTGSEALEKVFDLKPNIVVMDVMSQGLSGLDTCRLLKNASETSHIPIVMISAGRDALRQEMHALDAGADAYMSKPLYEPCLSLTFDELLAS